MKKLLTLILVIIGFTCTAQQSDTTHYWYIDTTVLTSYLFMDTLIVDYDTISAYALVSDTCEYKVDMASIKKSNYKRVSLYNDTYAIPIYIIYSEGYIYTEDKYINYDGTPIDTCYIIWTVKY